MREGSKRTGEGLSVWSVTVVGQTGYRYGG